MNIGTLQLEHSRKVICEPKICLRNRAMGRVPLPHVIGDCLYHTNNDMHPFPIFPLAMMDSPPTQFQSRSDLNMMFSSTTDSTVEYQWVEY